MRKQLGLEEPLQGKFRQDADRLPAGSGHRAEGIADSGGAEAAQLPRKEDAGTGALPADQRDGDGPGARRRGSGRGTPHGPEQVQAALAGGHKHRSLSVH